MRLPGIQEDLLKRLDVIASDWKDVIDYEKINEAYFDGLLDEVWLLKHLRDQFRSSVYKKVYEKGEKMSARLEEEGSASILSIVRDFGGFAYSEIETLLNIEVGIFDAISEHEVKKTFSSSKDASVGLRWISREESEKLKESSFFWDKELLAFFKEVVDLLDEVDLSRKSEWMDLKEIQLDLFRKENSRAVEVQEKLLNEDLLSTLKTKIESSEYSPFWTTGDIYLTQEEKDYFLNRLKELIFEEVLNQQKLRTEFVSLVAKKTIGKSSPEEIIEFIYSFDVLSDDQKNTLRDFILAGYVGFEDVSDAFFGAYAPNISSKLRIVKKCAKKIAISGILGAIQEAEDDHKRRIKAVYDSQVYKICNGGWWAGIAHIASFGFCTGYTVTAAVIDLLKGRLSGLAELKIIVKVIKFFVKLPPKITLCELFRTLLKKAIEDSLCQIVKEALFSFSEISKKNEEKTQYQSLGRV